MDPLLTNGIDPALLRGLLDKRDDARDETMPRRKRPATPGKSAEEEDAEEVNEENKLEADPDVPKHKLDDLA
jgi:hypothetical protein